MASTETAAASLSPAALRLKGRMRGLALRAARLLVRLDQPALARRILVRLDAGLPNSRAVRALINPLFEGHPAPPRITAIRASEVTRQIDRPVNRGDLPLALRLMGELALLGQPLPAGAARLVQTRLETPEGRAALADAAGACLAEARAAGRAQVPFLLYLYSLSIARAGRYQEAGALLQRELGEIAGRGFADQAALKRAQRDFDQLRGAWRVVDQIAREDTGWADADGESGYADLAIGAAAGSLGPWARLMAALGRTGRVSLGIGFKEPLLQARRESEYLDACQAEFDRAATLADRLRAVADMLRQGVRKQLTYHAAHERAGAAMDRLIPAILALTAGGMPAAMSPVAVVRDLSQATTLLRQLGREDEAQRLKSMLADFALGDIGAEALWLVLPELLAGDRTDLAWLRRSQDLRARLPDLPKKEHHLRAWLKWALWARAFGEVDRIFPRLPGGLRSSQAALYYANILQRQSRFAEAREVLQRVHLAMLARPAQLAPFAHWNLQRRDGELAFLAETASAFARVPQPPDPKGVIVIAARNLDQLRRYPLVVLMELRRRGWAVISLMEGLLPVESTGIPAIDVMAGSITPEGVLSPRAAAILPLAGRMEADLAQGRLGWMGLDLSHSLMEDARISRRTYDVDFTCPALIQTLQRLVDWTDLMARALLHGRAHFGPGRLPMGFMALFNSRLPDSLFRAYCARDGDPDTFFALQTANGYENYFANFGNRISTRCVVRNVTRTGDVRSASFPPPPLFARYFARHRHRAPEVLARVEQIAMARRSTVRGAETPPEAEAARSRIMAWRAQGRPVACLFGRVVCDSAVPFDGGPVHRDLKDWLNHSVEAVRGSDTLLLIKPHPYEMNEQIATYLNQRFTDLLEGDLPDNVLILGHRWFDMSALKGMVDLGLVYNGTVAVEMALMEIPCIQCNHFGPIDYPFGHPVPRSRAEYAAMLRFETPAPVDPEMRAKAALWLDYMSDGRFARTYRYHSRPVTNRVVYPPWWEGAELEDWFRRGDPNVSELAARITGEAAEPEA